MQIGTNAFLALGAIGTVTALIFTARSASAALESADATRASVEATRDGQITERYTRAVEQLYASSRGVRTGGVYALERIAQDSATDRPTVMQLLAAYVRDESPKDEADATTDIRVAATVVARNPLGNGVRTDLHNAGLTNAELHDAQFHGADLSGAQLGGVEFHRADLTAADLGNANLSGARLDGAHFDKYTDFSNTNLDGAILTGAHFSGTKLNRVQDHTLGDAHVRGADFSGADLRGIDLRGVVGLMGAQLQHAVLDGTTRCAPALPRYCRP